MSEHHDHRHLVRASAAGATVDEAIANAIAGMTDPQGHHASLTFDTFEVVKVTGSIAHVRGEHGTPARIKVLIEGTAHHGI